MNKNYKGSPPIDTFYPKIVDMVDQNSSNDTKEDKEKSVQ